MQKLSKKSLEIGNTTDPEKKFTRKCKFGEVYVTKDEKRNSPERPWYLYYPEDDWYTGGFKTKREAIEWYEHRGR